jgi:hypothetical protein
MIEMGCNYNVIGSTTLDYMFGRKKISTRAILPINLRENYENCSSE